MPCRPSIRCNSLSVSYISPIDSIPCVNDARHMINAHKRIHRSLYLDTLKMPSTWFGHEMTASRILCNIEKVQCNKKKADCRLNYAHLFRTDHKYNIFAGMFDATITRSTMDMHCVTVKVKWLLGEIAIDIRIDLSGNVRPQQIKCPLSICLFATFLWVIKYIRGTPPSSTIGRWEIRNAIQLKEFTAANTSAQRQ